jgi:hypothetical protein
MKLSELPESEQIEKVKETFIDILSGLAEDNAKIGEYVVIPAKPADPTSSMSATEKEAIAKQLAEFEAKTNQVAKIKEILSNVQRPEGCFCGTCVTVTFGNSVPKELEFLIEAAQTQAGKATY